MLFRSAGIHHRKDCTISPDQVWYGSGNFTWETDSKGWNEGTRLVSKRIHDAWVKCTETSRKDRDMADCPAVSDGTAHPDVPVRLPLASLNRHGLVAGATGTGKTKTLQLMAEQLIEQGVPVFLADIKGDLSGMASPGEGGDRITARSQDVGLD